MGRRGRSLALGIVGALAAVGPGAGGAGGREVTGRVLFRGAPPPAISLEVTKDHEACGERVPSDVLVVSPRSRGVRFAVVAVEGVPDPPPAPPAEATLENRTCRFVPHVLAVRTGSELNVVNADPVLHNLRGWLDGRGVFNVVQPTQGQVSRRTIKRAGAIRLSCDAHVHMHGWIVAFDHPYFAVTDADGRFAIPDVPAGSWPLTVWHEGWKVARRDEHGRLTWEAPRVVTRDIVVPLPAGRGLTVELGD